MTATSGSLAHSTSLTLQVTAPPSQGSFSIGSVTVPSLPPDGSITSVPITVTRLNGHTAPVSLRNASILPPGLTVSFSGNTMTAAAALDTPSGSYSLMLKGDDGEGGSCRGGGVIFVPPAGGGTTQPVYLNGPSLVTLVNDNQPRRFGPYYLIKGYSYVAAQSCSLSDSTVTASVLNGSQSDPNHGFSFDVTYTAPSNATVGTPLTLTCNVYSSLANAAEVYDATPTITGITLQSDGTYNITGTGFGKATDLTSAKSQLIVCPADSPTCTQTTPDLSIGQITLGYCPDLGRLRATIDPLVTLLRASQVLGPERQRVPVRS